MPHAHTVPGGVTPTAKLEQHWLASQALVPGMGVTRCGGQRRGTVELVNGIHTACGQTWFNQTLALRWTGVGGAPERRLQTEDSYDHVPASVTTASRGAWLPPYGKRTA